MTYEIFFRDSGVLEAGLSPTFSTFLKRSDGDSPGVEPSITGVDDGWFRLI